MYPFGFGDYKPDYQSSAVSPPACPRCNNAGRWVDHGPQVGRGWFCGVCKDDIPSVQNVYGLSAQQKARAQINRDDIGFYTTVQVNCTKVGCTVCRGQMHKIAQVDLKPGDTLRCVVNQGVSTILKHNQDYEVVEVTPKGVRVWVTNAKRQRQASEFSRCRFKALKRVRVGVPS